MKPLKFFRSQAQGHWWPFDLRAAHHAGRLGRPLIQNASATSTGPTGWKGAGTGTEAGSNRQLERRLNLRAIV